MKKHLLSLLLLPALASTSCTTMLKSSSAKRLDVYNTGIVQSPLIVDLDVKDQKVQGTASGGTASSLEALKSESIADATRKAGADVLVEPSFTVTSRTGNTTVEVSGFPATYKNFRPLRESDFKVLQYEEKKDTRIVRADYAQGSATDGSTGVASRKSGGGTLIGILAAVGVALVLAVAL